MKIISAVPEVLFFKATDLYTEYAFLEYPDN